MDIVDRLVAHDAWTTRQLLLACESLPDSLLDKEFDIDHKSLRETFIHIIDNVEVWTDLLCERPIARKEGNSIPELLERASLASRTLQISRTKLCAKDASTIALWISWTS